LHGRLQGRKKGTIGYYSPKEHDRSLFVKREAASLRKGDATRARILEETARQAAVRGFGAVSLGDVAQAAGLSKSGLFKHFESKEAMELEALDRTFDCFVDFVWKPAEALPPGRPRLEAVFDRWLDWTEVENAQGGCLLMAASIELDDQPGPMRDLLQTRVKRWRQNLTREMQALREPLTRGIAAPHDEMPKFRLPDADVDKIVAYINSLEGPH